MTSRWAGVLICFIAGVGLLAGCATPYQKNTFMTGSGYSDEKIGEGVYRVTTLVNAFTTPDDALKYWRRRAAELCGSETYESSFKQSLRGAHGFPFVQGFVRCPGSSAPIATIRDGGRSESSSKALIFYVQAVNGKSVDNSLHETTIAYHGQGMNFAPIFVERQVLAEGEVRLELRAAIHFGAPILALMNAGKNYDATQIIRLQPKPNAVYVVNGELTEARSAVWLEDDATGEKVGTPEPPAGAAK